MPTHRIGAVLASALIVLVGCTSTTPSTGPGALSSSGAADAGPVVIFAAASLRPPLEEIRAEFQRRNPHIDIAPIAYEGSSTLAIQIQQGAPADVFLSADEETMDRLGDLVTDRVDIATNTLTIAVAPGNPRDITGLADLARADVTTVLCARPVPCGAAAARVLAAADVTVHPASEETNVTAVLAKVTSGAADAGLVYVTDVRAAAPAAEAVPFPQAAGAVNTYPMALLSASAHAAAARAFMAFVRSAEGQRVLADAGFGPP